MLPYVKIEFANGAIGATEPMDDGCTGLVSTATAVIQTVNNQTITTFVLNTPYCISKLDQLVEMGINSTSTGANANLYKCVKEFYDEAPEGSRLWLMGVADTEAIDDIVDKTKNNAKSLIQAANGEIRVLIVKVTDPSGYTPTVTDGIDADVEVALTNAQGLAEWATESLYAPLFVIIEGRHYTGNATQLPDLSEGDKNRVCVLIGDTVSGSDGACVGLLAGRIASIPVQRSIARVRSGSIASSVLFIGSVAAENGNPDQINDKGYVCPRTFVGKAGYFWNDDKLATSTSDDYALITRRRVIDKAYRIAYQTIIDEIGEEISHTDDGKITAPVVKSIQTAVETAVINNMTSVGNLGNDPTDPNDMGVICYINPDQNILATSRLQINLRVKPHGYAKYIDVTLGFKVGK